MATEQENPSALLLTQLTELNQELQKPLQESKTSFYTFSKLLRIYTFSRLRRNHELKTFDHTNLYPLLRDLTKIDSQSEIGQQLVQTMSLLSQHLASIRAIFQAAKVNERITKFPNVDDNPKKKDLIYLGDLYNELFDILKGFKRIAKTHNISESPIPAGGKHWSFLDGSEHLDGGVLFLRDPNFKKEQATKNLEDFLSRLDSFWKPKQMGLADFFHDFRKYFFSCSNATCIAW